MEDKFHRRNFINRVSLGFASLMAAPFVGVAKNYKEAETELLAQTQKSPILDIKAMGFQWETLDPFLFCVHHEDKFPKGNEQCGPATSLAGRSLGDDFIIKDGWRMYHGKRVPGFPGHPHRGFETVTVVREGLVDHADSLGAAGRYGNGDVQWMTAGKGVQHSEMFPLLSKEKENPMELFQIWLNLPKRSKMVDPHFKMFWSDTIPKLKQKDTNEKLTEVEVMAGKLGSFRAPAPPPNSWASDPANEVAILNIKIDAGGRWILPAASKGINRVLYFYQGEQILLVGKEIKNYHSIHVEADKELIISNTGKEARILVLQGKPIGEPVIQYGPFVMNTKEEINKAFEDYHKTQFGGWPWPRYDQVHDRNAGRFALHADGRKEVKS
jgi:quercetin 2,3-dioxygenase